MKINNINRNQKQINADLIQGLRQIEASQLDLPLIPLNGKKQPLGDNWQQRPMNAKQLRISISKTGSIKVPITLNKGKKNQKQVIKDLPIQGYGVLLGHPINYKGTEYYLTAIDIDGPSARKLIPFLSGSDTDRLPKTVGFTSGRKGRCQALYLVPASIAPFLKYKKIRTGVKGDDGKDEALEFRWSRQQSVLPPSVHPTTGKYSYFDGCGIGEVEIAIAPKWVMLQMLQIENLTDALEKLALLYDIEIKRDGEKISLKTIEEINSLVNLLQLIQKYLRLKKSGKNYLGKCCFHQDEDDKKLSLELDPQKNRYYCFDCGASGGVTDFLSHKFQIGRSLARHQRRGDLARKNGEEPIKTVVDIPDCCNWSESDWAAYYVERLAPWRADDYDAWVKVGMALNSLGDESLLLVFERFSRMSPKYILGECKKKWRSFRRSGLTVASIYKWAARFVATRSF